MKKPALAIKISVLALSLSLATWFVAYRAGWFANAKPVAGKTDSTATVANSAVDTPDLIMPSSKSGEMISPQQETTMEVQAPKPARVRYPMNETNGSAVDENAANRADLIEEDFEIMGSSKSGKMFFPESEEKLPDTPDQKTRTIMGSSKSDDIFTPDLGNEGRTNHAPSNNASTTNAPANPGKRPSMMGSSKSGPIFTQPKADTVKKQSSQDQAPQNQAPNQNNWNNRPR